MAAVGDVYSDFQQVNDGNFLDTAPSSGHEAIIHNLYWGGAVELYFGDGTANEIKFASDSAAGGQAAYKYHVNPTLRVRIKNVSGGSIYIGYDGMYSKVT